MMWRVIRRLLAVGIRLLFWHPVVSLALVVLALGAVGFTLGGTNGNQVLSGPMNAASTAAVDPNVPSTPPPVTIRTATRVTPSPEVQQYIRGMVGFNAHLMWQSLDGRAVQAMVSQGGSEQALQKRLDEVRQNGAQYDDITYIGGFPRKDGTTYLFYVVTRRGFAARNVSDQVFFVFTVGPDGKILKIE